MLRTASHIISYVFHPLFILTYMLILLLLINPYLFGVNTIGDKGVLIAQMVSQTIILPVFATFMLKKLNFVKSMRLEKRMDRIAPYIYTGILYTWVFINTLNYHPFALSTFVLGSTIALFVAFFINNFSKISAHTVGAGGLLGMVMITKRFFSYEFFTVPIPGLMSYQISMSTLVVISTVICGLIGTSRLILGAHNNRDLYAGFVVGFLSQFLALQVLA